MGATHSSKFGRSGFNSIRTRDTGARPTRKDILMAKIALAKVWLAVPGVAALAYNNDVPE